MNPLKLVIFDCDGVMFDSKEANRHYYNHLLAAFDHPPMSAEELEYVHMHHVMDSVRHIFRHYPTDIGKAEQYRTTIDYRDFLQYMIMEPDLKDFLEFLKPTHHLAISTNRTNTMRNLLEVFGLAPYFSMVVTATDVKHPKPHPEALQTILTHFDMRADQAVYIGDSQVDVEHAAGAGMRLIAFKNPNLPADFHVTSFQEVQALPLFHD